MTGFHIDTGAPARSYTDGIGSINVGARVVDAILSEHFDGLPLDKLSDDQLAVFDGLLSAQIVAHMKTCKMDSTVRRRFWLFRHYLPDLAERSPEIHDVLIDTFLELLAPPKA